MSANLQPEIGKAYHVCLPGEEMCREFSVAGLTDLTVVLLPTMFYNYLTGIDYCDRKYAEGLCVRYPLSSIRFVEAA